MRRQNLTLLALAVPVFIGTAVVVAPEVSAPATAPSPDHAVEHRMAGTSSPPVVLFLGDSYTAGPGPGLAELSYGCLAAAQLHRLCALSAVVGTGYISGGPANRFPLDAGGGPSTSLAERIPTLAAQYAPDVVVLDGGRNDLFPPTDDVRKAMIHTITEARRAWPHATLVVLRPRYLAHPDDDLGFDDAFMAGLEADPAMSGVLFLDPIAETFSGKDTTALLGPDGKHPNTDGVRQLADGLAAALRARGIGEAS